MLLYKLYLFILGNPVRYIVLNGPRIRLGLLDVGFYDGKPIEFVCADITGVSHLHWNFDHTECETLLQNRIDSWLILVFGVFYLFILMRLVFWTATSMPRGLFEIARVTHRAFSISTSSECLPVNASVSEKIE